MAPKLTAHFWRLGSPLAVVLLVAGVTESVAFAGHCGDYLKRQLPSGASVPIQGECRQAPLPLAPVPAAPQESSPGEWLHAQGLFSSGVSRDSRKYFVLCLGQWCAGYHEVPSPPPRSFS